MSKDITVNNVNPYWRKSTKSHVKSVIVKIWTSSPSCLSSVNVDGIPCPMSSHVLCAEVNAFYSGETQAQILHTQKMINRSVRSWCDGAPPPEYQVKDKSAAGVEEDIHFVDAFGVVGSGGDTRLAHTDSQRSLFGARPLSLFVGGTKEKTTRLLLWTDRPAKNKSDPRQTRLCGRMWCSWWCCSWLLVLCFSDAAVAQGDEHGARNIREISWIEKRLLGW